MKHNPRKHEAEPAMPAAAPPAPIESEEIAKLRERAEEADALREQLLRAAADLQNFRRRAERETEDRAQRKTEALLLALLASIDELDRALAAAPAGASDSLLDGVRMIRRILFEAAEREGVKEIASVGQPFDPKFHEAMASIPTPDGAPGSVVSEQRRGYLRGDRVLRPAQVVVAQ